MEKVSINVLGCCVSRDIFNLKTRIDYEVRGYVQRTNPLLMFQDYSWVPSPEQPELEYVYKHCFRPEDFEHEFNRRMLRVFLGGGGPEQLLSRKGDWIVLDAHYIQQNGLSYVRYGNRTIYLQSDYNSLYKLLINSSEKYNGFSYGRITGDLNIRMLIGQLASFLSKNWGENIILINPAPAEYSLVDGKSSELSREDQLKTYVFCLELIKQTGCHFIDLSNPLVMRDRDLSRVHYITSTKQYVRNIVDMIVCGEYVQDKAAVIEYIQHRMDVGLVVSEHIMHGVDAEIRLNKMIESYSRGKVSFESVFSTMYEVVSQRQPAMASKMALLLTKQYPDLARIALISSQKNNNGLTTALVDLLLDQGVQLEYAYAICTSQSSVPDCKLRLWRMYHYGCGTDVNRAKSMELLFEIVESSPSRLSVYISKLYNSDIDNNHRVAHDLCVLTSAQYPSSCGWLGRMYRKGIGVDCDKEKSLKWYYEAASRNPEWICEYADAAYLFGDIVHWETSAKLCATIASTNAGAAGRLGRLYKTGKGVPVDLELARTYLKIAFDAGLPWAIKEYGEL